MKTAKGGGLSLSLLTFEGKYRSSFWPRRPNTMPFKVSTTTGLLAFLQIISFLSCRHRWSRQEKIFKPIKLWNFSTPFHSAFGFGCSRTRTSAGSKVSHTADIWDFPAQLWLYKISVWGMEQKYSSMLTEPKYSDSFRNYLGFSASMYFLYPGLFGQP